MKGRSIGFVGLLVLLLGLALAMAPAGTQITNQASASYIDSAGQPRTTTSNQVVTVVQQVYSFTITPDGTEQNPGQTRTALPGGQVVFNYQVQNTGNGTDTINLSTVQGTQDGFDLLNPEIFYDANCNGTLDAGETTPITSVTLAMGGTACVIVRATIPSGAQSGQYGNLNLAGASAGNPSVTDNNNWARAVATTAAALTATKSASPSGNVAPGDTITYTISGTNVGGSAASGVSVTVDNQQKTGILISDVIPNGLTVSTMPTGSAGAGTVSFVYSTGGTNWNTLTASNLPLTGNGTVRVGMLIEGTGNFFPRGAQYTFTFRATVPTGAPAGTSYSNTATVWYNDGYADQTTTTNSTTNTVAASYNVAVGPYGYPEGSASGSYTAGRYTVTRSGDTQTIATAYSGTEVIFRHTLRNTSNTSDSFTLSFSGAPSGWTCSLVADDLTTPLSGAVGPLAAGADYNFALKCQVPANYTSTASSTITVTATSGGDPTKYDTTTDTITQVMSGYSVDLAAHGYAGDNNAGNDNPPAQSTNPGTTVYFPIDVYNAGQVADGYNLSASLPSGWTALFYPDANCDGQMDNPAPAPVTTTGVVNPGETKCYIAAVSVPAGAAPGSNSVSFTATSTTLNTVQDTISTTVTVNLVAQVTLEPDQSGTVTSPGTIQYTHTLTNNSNADATCDVSGNGGSRGWTYQYSPDGTTWHSSLTNLLVPAGGSAVIYVRALVPVGEPIGAVDVNTVTASCRVGGSTSYNATDTATDITTIVGGELSLTKSAVSYVGTSTNVRSSDGSQAYPGDVIEYTIAARNIGTGDLTNVKVTDPLPAYTDFVSVSATATGFPANAQVLYSTDGTTWSATPPSSLSSGGSIYVGVNTDGNNTIDANDVMPPGAVITITFKVKVQ